MRVLIAALILILYQAEVAGQVLFPCTQTLQNPYGVCTHVTRKGWDYEIRDREMHALQEIGVGWVRSDLDFFRVRYALVRIAEFDFRLVSLLIIRKSFPPLYSADE